MGIYTFVDSLDNKTLFLYIFIAIIIIGIISKFSITLNIFFGLIIATIVIMFLYEQKTHSKTLHETQVNEKLKTIKPEAPMLTEKKDEQLIDFLFSIQDFYIYNPQAYEELVDNIDGFLKIYDTLFNEEKFIFYYYKIAENKKNNALNNLHSIIYKLPKEPLMTDKFDRSHKRLETILNVKLNELYDKCMLSLKANGYNIHVTPINYGPKEANHYTDIDKHFTFQMY